MTSSIIIVNFRAYADLWACLRSLEAEHAPAFEIIVVDQAPALKELARIRHEFPRVKFVESRENRGFAAGVNLGVSRSRGEALLLLNPDCEIAPDAVAQLAAWLEAHPGVGAVGPRVLEPDGTIQASARRFPDLSTAFAGRSSWLTRRFPTNRLTRRNLVGTADLLEPRRVDWVSGACVLVRRNAFEAIGGLDRGFFLYWEDADLGRRLKNAGWATVYLPTIEVVHTVGGSSRLVPAKSAIAFHRSALRYYWKHSRAAARAFVPLAAMGLAARLGLVLLANACRRVAGLTPTPEPRRARRTEPQLDRSVQTREQRAS